MTIYDTIVFVTVLAFPTQYDCIEYMQTLENRSAILLECQRSAMPRSVTAPETSIRPKGRNDD